MRENVVIYDRVTVGQATSLGHFTVIGVPTSAGKPSVRETVIGDNCIVGCHVTIFEGARVADGCLLDDYTCLGEDVQIGRRCKVIYGAKVMDKTVVEDDSVVGGFVCERAQIGQHSRVFGSLVHAHADPSAGWDGVVEASPVIHERAFIGFGALVVGGVHVGAGAYVAAGAVITRDIPSRHVAVGINKVIPIDQWPGKLSLSPFFKR